MEAALLRETAEETNLDVAEHLAGLEGDWQGWGAFRSVVHRVVGELLNCGL